MEMKTNRSFLLMSDDLKDRISDDQQAGDVPAFVIVIADRVTAGAEKPIVGVLRTVLFDQEPEIEFKVMLSEAFSVINSNHQYFKSFELQNGEDKINMPGPFVVKAARIQEVDPKDQMCVLALSLKRG